MDEEHADISISRAALRVELLETEIRLKEYFDTRLSNKADAAHLADLERRFAELESHVRNLQEDRRLSEERLKVAADVLATETERRREELATSTNAQDRKFTRNERIAGLLIALLAALATVYLSLH